MRHLTAALLAWLFFFALGPAAAADDGSVKRLVESKTGGRVEGVTKTPYLGLYEVRVDGQIIYTDEKVTYIFTGNIIDTKTMQNITQERLRKLSTINFSDLPLDQAVKIVRGNGKRVIATFEDPNCGYCKRLAKELQGMNDLTIYLFLYPILSKDSTDKAKAVWCANDRSKTWNEMMLNGTAPQGPAACDTPLEKNLALGERLRVTGTPTIFLSNGERLPGAVPAVQLEKAINRVAASTSN
jgi:thiol:disulfide interchange protein DsbC